jgi:hypothetical protein
MEGLKPAFYQVTIFKYNRKTETASVFPNLHFLAIYKEKQYNDYWYMYTYLEICVVFLIPRYKVNDDAKFWDCI